MVADLAAVYHYLVERLWDQSEHHTRMSEYLVAEAGCTGEEATGKLLKQRSTELETQMSKKWLLLKK